MRLEGKWRRRILAAALGVTIVGAPVFTAYASDNESGMSRHDEHRYNVRRGMYEKDGGSDTEVRPGMYADEEHRKEARDNHRDEHRDEHRSEERREDRGEHKGNGNREHRYNVRRGMYEKEGGSDVEVSRGRYEQPSSDGERRGLQR